MVTTIPKIPDIPWEYDKEVMRKLIAAIADPARARVYFEILFHQKVTAKHMMERLRISRSTLSYHLKKLEEEGIVVVGISTEGRPSKEYTLHPDFSSPSWEARVDESLDWRTWRSVWLQKTIAHMQALVSIAMTYLEDVNEAIQVAAESKDDVETPIDWMEDKRYAYGGWRLSDEDAALWFKMVVDFVNEFEPKLKFEGPKRHYAFMGLLQLTRESDTTDSSDSKRRLLKPSRSLREIMIDELTSRERDTKRDVPITTRFDNELVDMLDLLVKLDIFSSRSDALAAIVEKTLYEQRDKFETLKAQISRQASEDSG